MFFHGGIREIEKKDFDFYVPSIFKVKKELNLKVKLKIKKYLDQLLQFQKFNFFLSL